MTNPMGEMNPPVRLMMTPRLYAVAVLVCADGT